jgi:hypothetical protein
MKYKEDECCCRSLACSIGGHSWLSLVLLFLRARLNWHELINQERTCVAPRNMYVTCSYVNMHVAHVKIRRTEHTLLRACTIFLIMTCVTCMFTVNIQKRYHPVCHHVSIRCFCNMHVLSSLFLRRQRLTAGFRFVVQF